MLQTPGIAAVLSRSYYDSSPATLLEVHNERRFAVRDHDQILSGTIDRLVLQRRDDQLLAADIIDFKTDAIDETDPASIDTAVDHYRPQLEAYRTAVSKMFQLPLSSVTARLLFVGPGLIRSLGDGEKLNPLA